jgi:hypothetical protein
MTGRPNHQRLAMMQGSTTDFSDGIGLAEIDSHIAVFHRRFDCVAEVALRDDVEFWICLRKITDSFSHAPSRAD